jgi:hypothetical protein
MSSRVSRRLALCASALLGFCVSSLRGESAATINTHIHVTFRPARALPAETLRHALLEVARIWKEHDIAIESNEIPPCQVSGAAFDLAVDLATVSPDRSRDDKSPLGAVQFTGGRADAVVTIHVAAVTRLATSVPFMGLHQTLWPPTLRDQVVGRALGRALAHEIGHVLLESPGHAARGLMKARQRASVLISPDPRPFSLDARERARLALIQRWPSPVAAAVSPLALAGC